MNELKRRIQVARGEQPADLVLYNANVVNVCTGECYLADVAIVDGRIVGMNEKHAPTTPMYMRDERCAICKDAGSHLDPYKEYLVKRWNDGCRNAQLVYREIKEQGYAGSDLPVVRFFAQFREKKDMRKFKQVDPSNETPVKAVPRRPTTASQVAHWITFKEDQRLDWQQKYLTQLCEADPQIREAYELIEDFTTMLRERQGERLDVWLHKAESQSIAELRSSALSLKRDYEAVKAGLTLPWSQGPVEGHVHRLKYVWKSKLPNLAEAGAAMLLAKAMRIIKSSGDPTLTQSDTI